MMNLHIWDVQHGSAAYLKTPNGRHMVVDLGVGDITQRQEFFSPLRLLMQMGVRSLDQVIITHQHRDHLDDIFNFDALSPAVLYRPRHLTEQQIRGGNQPGEQSILDKYFEIDRRYDAPVPLGCELQNSVNWGMDITAFQPRSCPTDNLNNHSLVTFLTYAGSTICLPGDNEAPSWRELLQQEAFRQLLRQTNVFVAAHHGRQAGYCEEVFQYCSPYLIVVSDGPSSDTSAVDKYRTKASGWKVWSRSSSTGENRFVVTTRCDGSVYVAAGSEGNGRFLSVSVE